MKTFELVWSPTGQSIGTVEANDMKSAIKHAPLPYRKFKGEIYATEIKPMSKDQMASLYRQIMQ